MSHFIRIITSISFLSASFFCAANPSLEGTNSKINVSINNFLAVSCDATGNLCTAVGHYSNTDNSDLLVYQSQDAGLTWGTPVHLAKAANSRNSEEQAIATDIHCDASAQRCFIITSTKIDEDVVLLVYRSINGQQEWSKPNILPLPESTIQKDGRYIFAKLSCGYSGFSCIIAGSSQAGNASIPLLYSTKDAGRTWTLIKNELKHPWYTRANGISTKNVHCDNSGFFCKVVGYALTRNSFWTNYYTSKPVVYTTEDGGAHWSDPVILPSDIDGLKKASTLTSVNCDGTGLQCMAIGFTLDLEVQKKRFFSFTTTNGGVNWEKKSWINTDYSNEQLSAFDCDDSMMNCIVVGSKMVTYPIGASYLKGLIYSTTTNGQNWEINTTQEFSSFSYLADIFCNKYDGLCLAVGVQQAKNTVKKDLRLYESLLGLPVALKSNP